ncbi:hypothetical protein GGR57DRAFT_104990 [Xylariaceae sp. FL1272]|nr:hypothetical protein GGR57DRAFT_104990 [Xylariaceae sp. FL1272]
MGGSVSLNTNRNLQGECDVDGVCRFELKDGAAPVEFQPSLQECCRLVGSGGGCELFNLRGGKLYYN